MQDTGVWYDWLIKRGITDSVISDFGIRWGTNPTIGDCIVIPVIDEQGNYSFNKYRRDPLVDAKPKYVYDQGGKITLYGYHKAKKSTTILVTEGEMDALVAWSANIPAVTSTGGAMSFQKEWAALLADKQVVFCFDNDVSGGKGMVKALEAIPTAKVLFLPDRPGIKDISDYVAGGGNLAELLRSAVQLTCLQDVIDHRAVRLATWQSTFFHDAYIEEHTQPTFVRKDAATTDALSRANTYPIPKLLSFKANKAICPFHQEKTPSLHYYAKTNTCYCWGACGKAFDAVAIYRQLTNCSFKEALEKLV